MTTEITGDDGLSAVELQAVIGRVRAVDRTATPSRRDAVRSTHAVQADREDWPTRSSPTPPPAWSSTGSWPARPAPSCSTTWATSWWTKPSDAETVGALNVLMHPGRCGPSRQPANWTGSSGRRPRPSGSTRAGWPCAASAPTCGPSGSSSIRRGAPPCGPSWPGTGTASARPGTSTSSGTSVTITGAQRHRSRRRGPTRVGGRRADGRRAGRHRRRAGRCPPLPADRADDGPVGRTGVQAQGVAARPGGPARACCIGPGTT